MPQFRHFTHAFAHSIFSNDPSTIIIFLALISPNTTSPIIPDSTPSPPLSTSDEWEKQKPVEGHLKPADALQQLQLSEARLQRLKEERDNVSRAKEALELGDVVASAADDRLAVAFEELHDLKVRWRRRLENCGQCS